MLNVATYFTNDSPLSLLSEQSLLHPLRANQLYIAHLIHGYDLFADKLAQLISNLTRSRILTFAS